MTATPTDAAGHITTGGVTIRDQNDRTVANAVLQKDDDGDYFVTAGDRHYAAAVEIVTGNAGDGSDSSVHAVIDTGEPVQRKRENPLASLDEALQSVDALRGGLGAVQNRLASALDEIATREINTSAARSRILDADYAVETAQLSRTRILQEAGVSVLAQANQNGQSVLALLNG